MNYTLIIWDYFMQHYEVSGDPAYAVDYTQRFALRFQDLIPEAEYREIFALIARTAYHLKPV